GDGDGDVRFVGDLERLFAGFGLVDGVAALQESAQHQQIRSFVIDQQDAALAWAADTVLGDKSSQSFIQHALQCPCFDVAQANSGCSFYEHPGKSHSCRASEQPQREIGSPSVLIRRLAPSWVRLFPTSIGEIGLDKRYRGERREIRDVPELPCGRRSNRPVFVQRRRERLARSARRSAHSGAAGWPSSVPTWIAGWPSSTARGGNRARCFTSAPARTRLSSPTP